MKDSNKSFHRHYYKILTKSHLNFFLFISKNLYERKIILYNHTYFLRRSKHAYFD